MPVVSPKCRYSRPSRSRSQTVTAAVGVRRSVFRAWLRSRPTDADRHEAIENAPEWSRPRRRPLVAARLAPLHPPDTTFPGEALLDLAADAIAISGATRQSPLEFEGIRERYLPDGIVDTSPSTTRVVRIARRGDEPRRRRRRTPRRGSTVAADDRGYAPLEALATYVRAAADRTGQPVQSICRRIASERYITFAGDDAR